MQLWKMGSKCHKQIEMPQFNYMANIFLTFQKFFKILAQVATEIWKSLQLDLIMRKTQNWCNSGTGAKMLETHQNTPI
jgi:hypothetical protein